MAEETPEYIYHYTSIDILALILKHRKLRFNRIDKVDDMRECFEIKPFKFYNYLFVSSWTHSPEESIPLWNLYGKQNRGIRIKMPVNMFLYREIFVPEKHSNIVNKQGNYQSLFSYQELFENNCHIVPTYTNKDQFSGRVIYTDNITREYQGVVQTNGNEHIVKTQNLGFYKHIDWAFQNEYRFVLFILPSPPLIRNGQLQANMFPQAVKTAIEKGDKLEFDDYYLNLSPEVLNNIEVTLGPHCNEGDKIIIESLINNYTTDGSVIMSSLTGKIRR